MRAATIALTILCFLSTGLGLHCVLNRPPGAPAPRSQQNASRRDLKRTALRWVSDLRSIAFVQSSQARSNGSRPPSRCRKSILES
jgi:hypothetical protein